MSDDAPASGPGRPGSRDDGAATPTADVDPSPDPAGGGGTREGAGTADRAATTGGAPPLVSGTGVKRHYADGSLLGGESVKAVDGVDLAVRRGETLGLVGESGCGKTTLGRTLVGLETPTAGTVRYRGTDVASLRGSERRRWRRNTQLLFQDPESSLNGRLTVGEIVAEPLEAAGRGTPRERRARVRSLLETVGLAEEHYYRYPHQFSGGQKQRVAIARALVLEPEFLVLDEPVSALDASVQARVLNLLMDLQAEFGLTYLFIAHDLSVIRHVCDRVAVMYLGTIMERGPTDELFADPANPYTRSLLSAIPVPDPTATPDRLTLRGTPPSPRHPPDGCPFSTRCPMKLRPEGFDRVDEDAWEAIDAFRDVLGERERAAPSVRDRVRSLLGRSTRFGSVRDLAEELFAPVDLPGEAREAVGTAVDLAADGEVAAARAHLDGTLGGACDHETPALHRVSEAGRESRCLRHRAEHPEPPAEGEREG